MRPLHEPAFCLLYQEKACGMRELILINDRLRPIEGKITIVQSSHYKIPQILNDSKVVKCEKLIY